MDYFCGNRACQRSAEVRKRVFAAQTPVKTVQLTDAVTNRQAGKGFICKPEAQPEPCVPGGCETFASPVLL